MNIRLLKVLLTAFLIFTGGIASAALELLEEAYEVSRDDITLPAHAAGIVVIRHCTGCEPIVHNVDRNTVYLIDQSPVVLADLQAATKAKAGTMLYVFYSTKTGTVTRIQLDTSE